MPHSSGGGSHGGGSHGGSFGGSSHGGGSSRSTRSTYFPGSTRYVYYRNNKPEFVYANYDITQKPSPLRFLVLLFYAPFLLAFVLLGKASISNPVKLSMNYDTDIVISDDIGVIEDEGALKDSLEEFQDKTGITPAVITVSNEKWINNYTSLENYAYDLYVNKFDDEKHWLIIYSEPASGDSDFVDWYWEGMQGDDTDKILTGKKTNEFNQALQKYLVDKKIDQGEAIQKAFDDITPEIMKKSVEWGGIIVIVFMGGFIVVHAILMLVGINPKKTKLYQTAIKCDEEVVKQETCNYCGGIYVVGHHLNCPHCQAPVKAHDYVVDDEGRVTGILN